MTNYAIDLARRQHTQDRDDVKRNTLRAVDSLAGLIANVRKDVETDNKVWWWADHSQGLVYSAAKIERLINQLITWDRAVATLGQAEEYADRKGN